MTQEDLEHRLTHLDRKAAETPIVLPRTPFIESFINFLKDEGLAAGFDIGATGIVNHALTESLKPYILPFVGPVGEKGLFFARHLWNAQRLYQETLPHLRKTRTQYLKEGIQGGLHTLKHDLFIHDPIYAGLMSLGITTTDIHPVILSLSSYILGIGGMAAFDTINSERKHKALKKRFINRGFGQETYLESRFHLNGKQTPEEVLQDLAKTFNLRTEGKARYHDTYYVHNLPAYSGRRATMRIRTRERFTSEEEQEKHRNTAQIIFTRAGHHKNQVPEQFNYYPVEKEKLFLPLPEQATTIEDLTQEQQATLRIYQEPNTKPSRIEFSRNVARDQELLACVDDMRADNPYLVLELKVHKDRQLLRQAMRYVMQTYQVVQTTRGKSELFIPSPEH